MLLSNFLSEGNTLPCATLHSKKRIFETLSYLLAGNSDDGPISSGHIYQSLYDRERIGSTAIGHGVAIPHCRTDKIKITRMAVLILRDPLEYDSPDEVPVDIFIALLFPKKARDIHLAFLAKLASLFKTSSFKKDIRLAKTKKELYSIIVNSAEILHE
jgi:nitrogen PTS system EIIA component